MKNIPPKGMSSSPRNSMVIFSKISPPSKCGKPRAKAVGMMLRQMPIFFVKQITAVLLEDSGAQGHDEVVEGFSI